MPDPFKTFIFETAYEDFPEGGTRCDIVVAPDRDTARRLAAVQTLNDNEWNLESQGRSLLHFYGDVMEIHAEWEDLDGAACPNCTSHGGQELTDEQRISATLIMSPGTHVCKACGYAWLPYGFHEPTRTQLEAGYRETIEALDEIERKSLAGDEQEEE